MQGNSVQSLGIEAVYRDKESSEQVDPSWSRCPDRNSDDTKHNEEEANSEVEFDAVVMGQAGSASDIDEMVDGDMSDLHDSDASDVGKNGTSEYQIDDNHDLHTPTTVSCTFLPYLSMRR